MPAPDYNDIFGGGAMGAHYALQDRDREYATRQGTDQMQQANIRKQQLSNLFDEANNPQKLQEQSLTNTGLGLANTNKGYDNRINAVKADFTERTKEQAYSTEMRKLISETSKADMDDLHYKAQMAAQDPRSTPTQRAAGVRALKMHADFLKVQEQHKNAQSIQGQSEAFQRAQQQRGFANSDAKEATKAAAKLASSKELSKMSTDQKRSHFIDQMIDAQKRGDEVAYMEAARMIEYITKFRASERGDTTIGKSVMSEGAVVPMERRAPVVAPPMNSDRPFTPSPDRYKQPPPQLPAGWVMK